jgi:serine/threonine protein kinase
MTNTGPSSLPKFGGPYSSYESVPSHTRHAVAAHHDSDINKICKEYSYSVLKTATDGFAKSRILGTGSFGAVYDGRLLDQTDVAVKVISDPSKSGFSNEIKVLSKYRHPNLICLLGFARNGSERLLVYDCLAYGDCEKLLKHPRPDRPFPWELRLSVLLDACKGLTYLVTSNPMVFHRDIKSSNILVDSNGTAKMADFGLACELPSAGASSIHLRSSAGTMGYACPHYIETGIVSESSEIYSFGTCILDFLTNKPAAVTHANFPGQILYLVDSLQGQVDNVVPILDESARWPVQLAVELGRLVLDCCNRNSKARTNFVSIVNRLHELHQVYVVRKDDIVSPRDITNTSRAPQSVRKPKSRSPSPSDLSIRLDNRVPSFIVRALPGRSVRMSVPIDLSEGPFVFGRNNLSLVLNQLLPSETLRLCVSRDHFRIEKLANGGYMLVNISGNGTLVEKFGFLSGADDSAYIVNGDIIRLVQTSNSGQQTPFLELEFRLSNNDRSFNHSR